MAPSLWPEFTVDDPRQKKLKKYQRQIREKRRQKTMKKSVPENSFPGQKIYPKRHAFGHKIITNNHDFS